MILHKGESGVKNKGVPVAKSIAEANALAVRLGLAQRADFTGIDIDHANTLIQRLADVRQQFPQLPQLEYIGRGTRNDATLAWTESFRYHNDRDNIYIKNLKLNTNYFGDIKKQALQDTLNNPYISWPVKSNTPKGMIDHEIGHYLDYGFGGKGLSTDRQIRMLYRLYGGTKKSIMQQNVSAYAATNTREFLAECWSEYCNNPTPRAAAKAVGDRIIELYRTKGVN